ncbi:unnamed protein product [Cuscuta epithymum]|uniref:Uncharacterized protein n=1 Tax=Cuscuta epithymum TaxID=186058 RepID=A0AAV0E776_9ASTE|nr:unnamed protein product [Cuscuta epithymum]
MAEFPSGRVSFRSLMTSGGVRLRRWPPETVGVLQRASPGAADFTRRSTAVGMVTAAPVTSKTDLEKIQIWASQIFVASWLLLPFLRTICFFFLCLNPVHPYQFFVCILLKISSRLELVVEAEEHA